MVQAVKILTHGGHGQILPYIVNTIAADDSNISCQGISCHGKDLQCGAVITRPICSEILTIDTP